MFVVHAAVFAAQVVAVTAFYTVLGVARAGMLLFQGAMWLVNAAMLANPVLLVIAGIVALGAAVVAAVVYWDQWAAALMNTAAFQWIAGQLQALSDWFGTIGGWTGLASAAWDGIVRIFKDAIAGLIEMLNKIPGVEIDATFGDMPKAPQIPGVSTPLITTPAAAQLVTTPSIEEQAEQTRQRMSADLVSVSPQRATAVPQGGLLRQIQNTTNTTNNNSSQLQKAGVHVENLNLNNTKPLSNLELENMIGMAVG
jgi:hypothetical protein